MLCPATKAMATPANEACANASPTNESPFQTTNAPTTAQSTPTISVAASARCMNGKRNGSINSRTRSSIADAGLLAVAPDVDRVVAVAYLNQRHPRSVGRPQRLLAEHLRRSAAGHDPPIHERHQVELLGDRRKVVGGEQHGDAAI